VRLWDLVQEFVREEHKVNQAILVVLAFIAAIFLIMEAVALFFGLRIASGITGAVHVLHRGTLRLGAGDFDTHIDLPNEDEFGDLASSFNTMTVAVKRGREEAVARERLERELETARAIQQRLLPDDTPVVPGFDITGTSVPSRQVGGDYFDFLIQDDGRVGVAIGDVSGKGIPAALLMSNLQACLQGQVIHPSSVAEIVGRVNDLLVRSTDSQMFATFFYGVLDQTEATLTTTNAGHNPPIVCRADGSMEMLERGGLLLGMLPGRSYEQETIVLAPGDVVVLFTDGITEAEGPIDDVDADVPDVIAGNTVDEQGETESTADDDAVPETDKDNMFGDEHLEQIVRKHAHRSAAEIRDVILAAVSKHAADVPQSDDITLVVIKRLSVVIGVDLDT
ncbi:PP2C family protein-serine/threonine phosphatase, partial [Candidatus Eisenbacteria bacterium]